jgi:hypothetical protein
MKSRVSLKSTVRIFCRHRFDVKKACSVAAAAAMDPETNKPHFPLHDIYCTRPNNTRAVSTGFGSSSFYPFTPPLVSPLLEHSSYRDTSRGTRQRNPRDGGVLSVGPYPYRPPCVSLSHRAAVPLEEGRDESADSSS